MADDQIDRMIEAWSRTEPDLDVAVLHVVGRLLLSAKRLTGALTSALKPHDLTFAEFDVINTIRRRGDPDGTNPTDLARSALVTTGAIASRVERLERRGLVRRAQDPDDGRAVRIRLTPRGEAVARAALADILAADERYLEPLSAKQREAVGSALKRLLLQSDAH